MIKTCGVCGDEMLHQPDPGAAGIEMLGCPTKACPMFIEDVLRHQQYFRDSSQRLPMLRRSLRGS